MKTVIFFILLASNSVFSQNTYNAHQQIGPHVAERVSGGYSTNIVHNDPKDGQNYAQSSIKVDFHSSGGGGGGEQHQEEEQQQQQQQQQQSIQYSQPDSTQQEYQTSAQTESQTQIQNQAESNELQYQSVKETPGMYQTQGSEQSGGAGIYYQQGYQQPQQQQSISPSYLQVQPYAQIPAATYGQRQPQQLYNVGYSINIGNSAPKLSYRLPNPPPSNFHSYRQQKLINADVITGTHKDKVEKPSGYYQRPYQIHRPYGPNEIRNSHGYTWRNLSPGVEISGYNNLNEHYARQQGHRFNLGRSQAFDLSNVVENGKKLNENVESQSSSSSNAVASALQSTGANFDTGSDLFKFQQQAASTESFPNVEFDKSLIDNFYSGYKPAFFPPEITLPSPKLPNSIHLANNAQFSNYNFKLPSNTFQFHSDQHAPQQQMINQHYGYVQAENIKPVRENTEDHHAQQTQHHVSVHNPLKDTVLDKNTHKKYFPTTKPAFSRPYGHTRNFMYGTDKNYRLNTGLRPPPMIFIHQKYTN